jgi:hypothetical protein
VSPDPHTEYVRRLEERVAVANAFDRRHIALGNIKLAVLAVAGVMAAAIFGYGLLRIWWLLAPALAFVILAIQHEVVLRRRRRAARAAAFYESGIARLEGRWAGAGFGGEPFDDPAHPYCEDLDLFGRGSLYEMLCTARLRTGEQTLARWLLQPAAPEEVRARQDAVEELRPRIDLREDLALLGEAIRSGVNPGDLARWGEESPVLESRAARILAAALAAAALVCGVLWWAIDIAAPFLLAAAAEVAFYLRSSLPRNWSPCAASSKPTECRHRATSHISIA